MFAYSMFVHVFFIYLPSEKIGHNLKCSVFYTRDVHDPVGNSYMISH